MDKFPPLHADLVGQRIILQNVWFEVFIGYILNRVWLEVLIGYIVDNVWLEILIAYILDDMYGLKF